MSYYSNEIKKEEKAIKLEMKKTELSKMAFIREIKNGLGEEIKANPNKIIIKTNPKVNIFKRIFNKLARLF